MTAQLTTSPPGPPATGGGGAPRLRQRADLLQKVLAFGALIILLIVFSALSEYFLSFSNLVDILLAAAVTGVLAIGATFVITTGGIDLSVGTVMTLSAVMAAQTMTVWHLPVAFGVLAALATGAICGLVNGVLVAKMGLPPFIATLGTFYAGARARPGDLELGADLPHRRGHLPRHHDGAARARRAERRRHLLRGRRARGADPRPDRAGAVHRLARQQRGGHPAVRVRTDRWKIAVYTLAGVFTGLAGVLLAGRIGSAQPSLGAGYELDAIAAAVIGGPPCAAARAPCSAP
jgi:ribose transport system permease protein